MEDVIEKLKRIDANDRRAFDNWSLEEIRKLLNIYYIFSTKEHCILDLIYTYHECDSFEEIFRDYDIINLQDKSVGIEIAIDNITEDINKQKTHSNT